MGQPETISFEGWKYKSSIENIKEIERVTKQTQMELKKLQGDIGKNSFFNSGSNERENKVVIYDMDLVKRYLKLCVDDENFKITSTTVLSPLVMAVQIGLESLDKKYDVWRIDWLLKSNSGKASDTEKAIMKFQEDNWLKVDGIPWKKTIGILLKKIGELWNNGNVQNASNDKKREKSVFEVRRNKQATNNGNVDLQDLRYDNLIKNKNWRHDPEKPQVSIDHWNEKEQDAEIIVQWAKTEEQVEQTPTADSEATTLPTEEAAIEAANDAEAKAAKNKVITLIASLPEENAITTNDKSTITAARQAYEALADKSGINTDKLTKAEAKIRELEAAEAERSRLETEAKAAKENVINLIANIPEENAITTNDKSTITAARQAYEALADKSGINTDKLTKAEAKIKALETLESETRVAKENVKTLIAKLPDVDAITIDDKNTIFEARQAYNALAEADRSEINTDKLTKAEAKIKALETLESEARVAKNNVINLIASIPEENAITLNDENTITAARQAYTKLDSSIDIDTDILLRLLNAEKKLSELKIKNVEDLIDLLPDVEDANTKNMDDIYKAKNAFDALGKEEQKKLDETKQKKLNAVLSKIENLNNNFLLYPLEHQQHYWMKMDNIDMVKWTDILKNANKLKAQTPEEVGWLWNSILDWIERYATIKFPHIDWISWKETTTHPHRFKSEQDVINYKIANPNIKSFVLYFGWNTSNNDQTIKDIEQWALWLKENGIEPVLCTSIGVDLVKHTTKLNYKEYNGKRLVDLNAKIRQLAQDNWYPLIDYALIDDNIKIWSDGLHPVSYNLMNRMLDECLDKQKKPEN